MSHVLDYILGIRALHKCRRDKCEMVLAALFSNETPLNKALKAAVHSRPLGKKYVGSRSDCLGDTLTHARLKHSKPQSQGLSVDKYIKLILVRILAFAKN